MIVGDLVFRHRDRITGERDLIIGLIIDIDKIENKQHKLFEVYHVLWPGLGEMGHYKNQIQPLRYVNEPTK